MLAEDPLSDQFYRDFSEYASTAIKTCYGEIADQKLRRILEPEIRRWVERASQVTETPTLAPITDESLARAAWELLREEGDPDRRRVLESLYEYARLEWFYRPEPGQRPTENMTPRTHGTGADSPVGIVKRILTAPPAWIALAAFAGLIFGGERGLVIGFLAGLLLTLFVGGLVRVISGGSVPRRVRRSLVTNVIAEHPDAVKRAFPNLSGDALFKAVEAEVEQTIKAAASVSPSHEAIFAENVMRVALRQRVLEERDPDRQRMLKVLGDQLLHEWYPDSPDDMHGA